jgi:ABC-2 type transport system permease protein
VYRIILCGKKGDVDMKAIMDKYNILIKTFLKYHLKYPMGLFIKLIYLPIQMLISIFLWIAVSSSKEIDIGYMICYYLLANLLGYAYPFLHIAKNIQTDIMEGGISNYLVRPMNYVEPIWAKYLSWMVLYSVVFIPTLIIIYIIYHIALVNILGFVLFAIMGMTIEFLLWYNIGQLTFFLGKVRGIMMITRAIRTFLSGALLPLSFFPEHVRNFIDFLPFKFYIYTPINFVLSDIDVSKLYADLLIGCCWIFILIFTSKISWYFGIQKYQNNFS